MSTDLRLLFHGASLSLALALVPTPARAHETGSPHPEEVTSATPLGFITEKRGPVRAPRPEPLAGVRTTGTGFWTFVAARDKVPVPAEAQPKLIGAHGTVIVDSKTDTVYWGLQDVGWIAFTDKLAKSAVIPQDAAFKTGNLHGADLLPRRGKTPLIAAADNVQGEVYLVDTTFQHPQTLRTPNLEPYADGKGYAPTDVAFAGPGTVWVTDGYGKAWFMPAGTDPLQFQGQAFGGKKFSGTPHGITYRGQTGTMLVSARPEGLIKDWSPKDHHVHGIHGLPPGSTVCDVDVWGDYLLAPCLDGANKSAGPIYIVNLKKKAIVATLKPKEDLGYADAQHIHDACWYVTGSGSKREVYVIYTNWNPGGVGALRLVNVGE